MKILVTGAAGRIGRNLTKSLIGQGASVRGALLQDDPGLEQVEKAGVECVAGNLRDSAGCDAIVHLGAIISRIISLGDLPELFSPFWPGFDRTQERRDL